MSRPQNCRYIWKNSVEPSRSWTVVDLETSGLGCVNTIHLPSGATSVLKERPLMILMMFLGDVSYFKRTFWSFCFHLFVCVPEQFVFNKERALPPPARLKMSDAWRIPKMGKTQPHRLTSSAEFLARKNVCNHSLSPRLPGTQECSLYETCQRSIRLEGRRRETNWRGSSVEKAKVTRVSLIFKHLDTC